MFDVYVAGQTCLDLTPKFKDSSVPIREIFAPGGGMRLTGIEFTGGGAVCNTGLALHSLGQSVCGLGLVGNDLFARELEIYLKARGMAVILTECEGRTPYTLVIVQPGEDRIFFHDPGVDDLWTSRHLDVSLLETARLFHFGYPTCMESMYKDGGKELVKLFQNARAADVTTSLDMSVPRFEAADEDWLGILEKVLPYVDLFCPSIEEALCLVSPREYNEFRQREKDSGQPLISHIDFGLARNLAERFTSMGAGVSLVKCSAKGLILNIGELRGRALVPLYGSNWRAGSTIRQAALSSGLPVLSTSGAGDTAIGGFISAVLEGMSADNALLSAAMAGSLAVSAVESTANLPGSAGALVQAAKSAATMEIPSWQ